jgi:pyruvate dehydrogenase E2 component (dihydrolipoamide acetyltransferase)
MNIKVPFLGDGIDSAVVLSILVKVGDTVAVDDTLLEIESDKAVAPVPSPVAGVITSIAISEGDKVSQGALIGAVKSDSSEASSDAAEPEQTNKPSPEQPVSVNQPVPSTTSVSASVETYHYQSASGFEPPTSPRIKKIAREIGLDLTRVKGSERGGRINMEDVRAHLTFLQAKAYQSGSVSEDVEAPKPVKQAIDFSKFGEIEIEKTSSLRQKIAAKMQESWQSIPHVTQFDDANISSLMNLRKVYKPAFETKKAALTVTVFALKSVVKALKAFPNFNASYDDTSGEVTVKKYYNIGVAVDTPSGLIVPVIKDVDKKSMIELSLELNELAEKARERKLKLEDIQGGSFTISNLGSLGVGAFTPIVNAPEVAILGMGRGQLKPTMVSKTDIKAQLQMPLAVSYDHRLIDGADAARFIRVIIDDLEAFDEAELKEN